MKELFTFSIMLVGILIFAAYNVYRYFEVKRNKESTAEQTEKYIGRVILSGLVIGILASI